MVEHTVRDREVVGSSPATPTSSAEALSEDGLPLDKENSLVILYPHRGDIPLN